jgi:hypothetical protein
MKALNSKVIVQTIAAMKQAGWSYVCSVMTTTNEQRQSLAYGLLFTKDGKKFYFNKDTYIDTMTAEENAIACLPLFN